MKYLAQKISILLLMLFTFITASSQCIVDCVWPGDANNNGIVNNVDFIFTGLVDGNGGPSRAAGEQGIDWEGKTASNWPGFYNFLPGVNHKHADADGDGFVDGADLYSLNQVYDSTNTSFSGLLGQQLPGNNLFLLFQDTVIESGDTIIIDIHLGDTLNPIVNLHGIAFSINFDTSKIKEFETVVDFHGGWLGTPFVDVFTFDKYDPVIEPRRADFAATRSSNGPVSGFGVIGRIIIITEDDLAGKKEQIVNAVSFSFQNVLGLDPMGNNKNITSKNDSVDVSDGITPIYTRKESNFHSLIFPNPCQSLVNIKTDGELLGVKIKDMMGKEVYYQNRKNLNVIDVSHFSPGIYWFEILFRNESVIHKVVIRD